jgi:inosine-uridine nucleoside N-ribohydrolase
MATTKNELTQIKALEIVVEEGKAEGSTRPADVQAKLEEVLSALIKKKENRKPKAQSEEDKAYTDLIVETLKASDKGLTIGEIIAGTDFGVTLSSSKVTALVKKIDGVTVTVDKRKNYYSLAE